MVFSCFAFQQNFFHLIHVLETYGNFNLFPHSFSHFSEGIIDGGTGPACCICHVQQINDAVYHKNNIDTVYLFLRKNCVLQWEKMIEFYAYSCFLFHSVERSSLAFNTTLLSFDRFMVQVRLCVVSMLDEQVDFLLPILHVLVFFFV